MHSFCLALGQQSAAIPNESNDQRRRRGSEMEKTQPVKGESMRVRLRVRVRVRVRVTNWNL